MTLRPLPAPRHRRRTRDREHGQILVLFTIFLVALLAFTALVLDLGLLRNNRQILANALDAGALAGGTLMPVGKNGSKEVDVEKAVRDSIRGTYPGIQDSAYTISYRCLIGADKDTGAPLINRDIPIEPASLSPKGATQICDPTGTLGGRPQASNFIGAGLTRNSPCDPSPSGFAADSDKCNVVVVSGSTTTDFSFGRVVGVNEGNTGVITTAACNGPCGEPVAVPLDVVMVMDRTYSMVTPAPNMIPDLKDAGRAVLEAYDPKFQHVALSLIGPSSPGQSCPGSPTGVKPFVITEPVIPPTVVATYESSASTNPSGSNVTSLAIPRPSGTGNDDVLVATIALKVNSGSTAMSSLGITAPTGWTLIRRTNQGSGNTGVALATYWRRGGGGTSGTPAGYTFSFTGGSNYRASGGIMRFSDVVTSGDPIFNSSGNNGSGNTATANSISNAPANGIVIATYARSESANIGQPSNWSERYNTPSTGSNAPTVSANTRNIDGNTGNQGVTGGSNAWAAQQIALRAAPTPPPDPPEYGTSYGGSYEAANAPQWIPVELTGLGTLPGTPRVDEAYNFSASDPIGRPLNPNSKIVRAIACMEPAMTGYPGTNLKTPIEMATAYLNQYGRPGVKKGIILETDGSPQYSTTGDSNNYRCDRTNDAATAAKAAGIEIYTIGFFRGGTIPGCIADSGYGNTAKLLADMASGPRVTPNDCTERENGDGDFFFCASSGANLRAIFLQVATELADLKSRLVSVYPPPNIDAIGPNTGSAAGGYDVIISGKNFTGATSVNFGGNAATSFTVLSDSQIRAGVPAGPAGQTVHVRVTTGGGASPTEAADRFNYLP